MSEINGRFSGKQKKEQDAGTSTFKFLLVIVVLLVTSVIWQTVVIGLVFGVLMSAILLAATFFAPPLSSGACDS